MGCWVILNYLNKVKYEGQVAGVVLVAGGGSENLDYTRLKKIIRRRFVIHSDNDPIVEPERSRRLAKDLDAEEIELPGLGHFNDLDEGVPEILQAVLDCY
jgi:predicted alpha/beta hydrolase family esterase